MVNKKLSRREYRLKKFRKMFARLLDMRPEDFLFDQELLIISYVTERFSDVHADKIWTSLEFYTMVEDLFDKFEFINSPIAVYHHAFGQWSLRNGWRITRIALSHVGPTLIADNGGNGKYVAIKSMIVEQHPYDDKNHREPYRRRMAIDKLHCR